MNLYLTKKFPVADWNSMGRVIAQPRFSSLFQDLAELFKFSAEVLVLELLNPQKPGRVFRKLG